MALTEDAVREELKKVIDPELFVNIVDLGLIYEVYLEAGAAPDGAASAGAAAAGESAVGDAAADAAAADESAVGDAEEGAANACEEKTFLVKIEMTMTSPMCPAGPQLIANSKAVLKQLPQVGDVEIKVVMDPPWTPDRMTDDARDQLGIF